MTVHFFSLSLFTQTLQFQIQDTKKLQEFCCGLNVWSEKAAEIFNIKEEDKEAFLSDPKLKPKEEYPDWLWDPELLLDINKLSLEDIDPDKNPELYWKKVRRVTLNHEDLTRIPTVKLKIPGTSIVEI